MPIPELDGKKILRGVAIAYGEDFAIEIAPSKNHLGYYHIAVTCFADNFCDETKKPVRADGVEDQLKYFLKIHGLLVDNICWHTADNDKPVLADQETR